MTSREDLVPKDRLNMPRFFLANQGEACSCGEGSDFPGCLQANLRSGWYCFYGAYRRTSLHHGGDLSKRATGRSSPCIHLFHVRRRSNPTTIFKYSFVDRDNEDTYR